MKFLGRQFLHLIAVAAASSGIFLCSHGVWPQAAKTIKLIVPYAAGGPTDTLARVLVQQIVGAQGPAMLIENRPGAGAVIGTEVVSRAAPDGDTLLINTSSIVINSHLIPLPHQNDLTM